MASEKLGNLLNLKHDGDLRSVIRRARAMGELTHALCKSLPEDFAGAVLAANLRDDGELVVIAASPAWASRLRYEEDVLLAAARDTGVSATRCRVRVSQDQ